MKKLLILLVLSSPLAHSIDNGTEVAKGKYPSVVKISNYKQGGNTHCTGTLLSPTVVITAAHCVDRANYKQQYISFSGGKGILAKIFGSKTKARSVHYLEAYHEATTVMEMQEDWFRSEVFKRKSADLQQSQLYKYKALGKRKINLDIAFIELTTPQEIHAGDLAAVSCEKLQPMTEVSMVGYGQNILKVGGENINSNFKLQEGHNWYTIDEEYHFFPEQGHLVNRGDSGGPLFMKDDPSKVFGIASYKTVNKSGINSKSTYASTASLEAQELYRKILSDSSASEELKKIVKPCLAGN